MFDHGLSPAECADIVKRGGPTFTPLHGGFFRLNQAARYNRLTPRDMEVIRHACFPRKAATGRAVPPRLREQVAQPKVAYLMGPTGHVRCPRCDHLHRHHAAQGVFHCHACGKPIMARR